MATSVKVALLEDDFPFEIVSHLVPVPSFREYRHAIIDEQQELHIAVKQYIPRTGALQPTSNGTTTPATEPITIIAAAALGCIKELYEPLFVEVLARAQAQNVSIRSIWIADMFNVGESAVANQNNLGCDPAWTDHARDMWAVITHFRTEMVKPIVGFGHSFGANQLVCIASWHPTFFHSFMFVEAGIDPQYGRGISIPWMTQVLQSRDAWSTKDEADAGLIKVHGAQGWDQKVLTRFKHYGIIQKGRDDGQSAGKGSDPKWVMTTPKDQLAALVSRCNWRRIGLGPNGLQDVTLAQRELVPDSSPDGFNMGPFYRPELHLAWDMLPHLRPWVLYVNGGKSPFFGHPRTREERARRTGTGVGGNGGMALGAVKQVVVDDGEHNMVFIAKTLTVVADHMGEWLAAESQRWVDGPKRYRDSWLEKGLEERQAVEPEFVAALAEQMKARKSGKL